MSSLTIPATDAWAVARELKSAVAVPVSGQSVLKEGILGAVDRVRLSQVMTIQLSNSIVVILLS